MFLEKQFFFSIFLVSSFSSFSYLLLLFDAFNLRVIKIFEWFKNLLLGLSFEKFAESEHFQGRQLVL